jgi:heme-degrading monooxygenase HmoA
MDIPAGSYVVIFANRLKPDHPGYKEMAQQMMDMVEKQPGFQGAVSLREGLDGVTISYWESKEAIAAWREVPEHLQAQQSGQSQWYDHYDLQVCKVEDARGFSAG